MFFSLKTKRFETISISCLADWEICKSGVQSRFANVDVLIPTKQVYMTNCVRGLQIQLILTVILCTQPCISVLSYFVWYLNLWPITLSVVLLLVSPIYGATNQLFVRMLCMSVISVNQLIYFAASYHKSSDSQIQELFLFTMCSGGANLLFCNYRGPDIFILTLANNWDFQNSSFDQHCLTL